MFPTFRPGEHARALMKFLSLAPDALSIRQQLLWARQSPIPIVKRGEE
jgi:hypothetical protein